MTQGSHRDVAACDSRDRCCLHPGARRRAMEHQGCGMRSRCPSSEPRAVCGTRHSHLSDPGARYRPTGPWGCGTRNTHRPGDRRDVCGSLRTRCRRCGPAAPTPRRPAGGSWCSRPGSRHGAAACGTRRSRSGPGRGPSRRRRRAPTARGTCCSSFRSGWRAGSGTSGSRCASRDSWVTSHTHLRVAVRADARRVTRVVDVVARKAVAGRARMRRVTTGRGGTWSTRQ